MICRILLLIVLTSRVCGRSLRLRDEVLLYRAQENSDVTVEWRFSCEASVDVSLLKIHCLLLPELKVFYHLDNSSDEDQHQQFAGRVRCDEDALSAGRVRLHLTGVGPDDSGRYLCRMVTRFGKKVREFSLNITAATTTTTTTIKPKPVTPEPVSRGRICLYVVLGLGAAAVLAAVGRASFYPSYTALQST